MNVLDLFSGIGGFSLGLERAGMRTVAFCESDEFCRAVLRKHWPHVPCFDDVRTLDASRLGGLGRIDLICGGFPCQPYSVAGKQKAQADDRHLWPEMRRVIALARPPWVVGENVTGLIALALDEVLADLEGLRYAPRAFVIPAVAVDAKHRRDRVWIIARNVQGYSAATDPDRAELRNQSRRSDGSCWSDPSESSDDGVARALADADGAEWRTFCEPRGRVAEEHSLPQGKESAGRSGSGREDVADPNAAPSRQREHGGSLHKQSEPTGSDRNSGPRWWPIEPDVGRVADGVPSRMDCLRALGNAVVPQVVEEIGRAIMRCSQ